MHPIYARHPYSPRLHQEIEEAFKNLAREHPERFQDGLPNPKRTFYAALSEMTATHLRQLFPTGYGGHPDLKEFRRTLLEQGKLPYQTDFDAIEARLDQNLEQGDLRTLEYGLQHSQNPPSSRVFELKYQRKLPRTQKAVRALLETMLSPEALARRAQHETQRKQSLLEREIANLESRMKYRLVRVENGKDITMLEWAQPFLDGLWVLRKVRRGGKGVCNELHQIQTRLYYSRPFALAVEWLILKGIPQD